MSESNYISIKGAKVNNLKNIDVDIPRNKLVVITGLSGSGKSSLAFDTLYAEAASLCGSLSSYARQFLGRRANRNVIYQRNSPCHCHRTESKQSQPAFHRRNLDRNI